MDRFTTKENPKAELLSCIYCMEHSNCYSNMSCNEIYNALSKLRYYENLEEQGKLMILPCKAGDTIYYVNEYRLTPIIEEYKVYSFTFDFKHEIVLIVENGYGFYKNQIFLTKAEAEKRLKELQNDTIRNG